MKNIKIDYKNKFLTRVMNTTGQPVDVTFPSSEAEIQINFNEVLTEDPSSIFSIFYTSTFDTPDAVLVEDLEGHPVAQGRKVDGCNVFNFKMLAPPAGIEITIVAIGQGSQWISVRAIVFPNTLDKAPMYNMLYVMSIEDQIYC